jgi:hypothetical protein
LSFKLDIAIYPSSSFSELLVNVQGTGEGTIAAGGEFEGQSDILTPFVVGNIFLTLKTKKSCFSGSVVRVRDVRESTKRKSLHESCAELVDDIRQ